MPHRSDVDQDGGAADVCKPGRQGGGDEPRQQGLEPGTELEGPAVIEEPDSTTLVFPGDALVVHESGVLVLTVGGAR